MDHVRQLLNAIQYDPRDHELPGNIATLLYQLGLIEEGDDFRDRVMAIAPTSPVAYQLAMIREINTGNEEASLAAARRIIEDDIDDRKFAYSNAVKYLMRTAARDGTVAETEAFIEQHAPGIFDIESSYTSAKYRDAQIAAFDAWFLSMPRDEFKNRMEEMLAFAVSFGLDPQDDPKIRMAIEVSRGQTDAAIETALNDVFTRPVTANLNLNRNLAQPQYAELVADERIQAAMDGWEEERGRMRDDVRSFLEELSAG